MKILQSREETEGRLAVKAERRVPGVERLLQLLKANELGRSRAVQQPGRVGRAVAEGGIMKRTEHEGGGPFPEAREACNKPGHKVLRKQQRAGQSGTAFAGLEPFERGARRISAVRIGEPGGLPNIARLSGGEDLRAEPSAMIDQGPEALRSKRSDAKAEASEASGAGRDGSRHRDATQGMNCPKLKGRSEPARSTVRLP